MQNSCGHVLDKQQRGVEESCKQLDTLTACSTLHFRVQVMLQFALLQLVYVGKACMKSVYIWLVQQCLQHNSLCQTACGLFLKTACILTKDDSSLHSDRHA